MGESNSRSPLWYDCRRNGERRAELVGCQRDPEWKVCTSSSVLEANPSYLLIRSLEHETSPPSLPFCLFFPSVTLFLIEFPAQNAYWLRLVGWTLLTDACTRVFILFFLNRLNSDDVLFSRQTNHSGPVRGLHFNPFQQNLLSSASSNGEVQYTCHQWSMTLGLR